MKIIDITRVLGADTPVYPNDGAVELTRIKTQENDGYLVHKLTTSLHACTHLDVPAHMLPDNRTVADFSAESFIGRGVLLDVRGETELKPKPGYGNLIKGGDMVLLYTGGDEKYGKTEYFTQHPIISADLCRFFVDKKIKLLGMDTPSPDRTPFEAHKILLESGVFILENLTNLHELIGIKSFELIALPLKIKAEASPVRAVCRVV